MERNIKSLIGYAMGATDGEIGNVEEFYFDDQSWVIRYLVVKTGSWLFGRSVLISPIALQKPDWAKREFPVNLTKDQVSNSPDINTHKPVSHQHEIALYEHYTWQPYQASGYYSGGQWGVIPAAPLFNERILQDDENTAIQKENNDVHLRSTERITGYHIHTSDAEIGHVTDFVIDDETFQILYFVIDTHNWIGGKKVLIPVSNIKELKWEMSEVIVDITTDEVRTSKLFIESA
ncbi:MAG: PRC-barrel domain-containing protein [Bacteroidota bacterium]|nr:PRC-barrel domain-containing protein [Bacteroidota bacterium]